MTQEVKSNMPKGYGYKGTNAEKAIGKGGSGPAGTAAGRAGKTAGHNKASGKGTPRSKNEARMAKPPKRGS